VESLIYNYAQADIQRQKSKTITTTPYNEKPGCSYISFSPVILPKCPVLNEENQASGRSSRR
jgi:hypothetical protein